MRNRFILLPCTAEGRLPGSILTGLLIPLCIAFFLFSLALDATAFPPHRLKHRPVKKHIIVKHRYMPAPLAKRPARPGAKYVWIPRYKHPSGVYIGGLWRPPYKAGFTWVEGFWNDAGEWVFGYWKPVKVKKGYLWVPGYFDGSIWVEGYWRPELKRGYLWAPGHYNANGRWVKGHWKKL